MVGLDAAERLAVFRGSVLSPERDDVLQSIVAEAAGLARCPIALVSLVMGTVQFFRASVGIPPELETSLATSRCHSFCQFVVGEAAPFTVENASRDVRVPQRLVEDYAIEAYVGVPVWLEGQVLGSLCVIDLKERKFPPSLIDKLEGLARRVEDRLRTLIDADRERITTTSPEALADAVLFQARLLERALAELGPLVRLAGAFSEDRLSTSEIRRATAVLTETAPLFDALSRESSHLTHLGRALRDALPNAAAGTQSEPARGDSGPGQGEDDEA